MHSTEMTQQLSLLPAEEQAPVPAWETKTPARQRMTEEEKEALEKVKKLAPKAADIMEEILDSPKASYYAKIQVITQILNRTYGLPESSVKVTAAPEPIEMSVACIHALVRDLIPPEEGV